MGSFFGHLFKEKFIRSLHFKNQQCTFTLGKVAVIVIMLIN